MAVPAAPIFKNITRYFGKKADKYIQTAKSNLIPDDFLRAVDENLGVNPTLFAGNKNAFMDASEEGVKATLRKQYTAAREKELFNSIDTHLKDLKPGQDLRDNVGGFFETKIKNATFGYEERQNLFVSQLENGILKEGGQESLNLYNILFNYPKTGNEKFGYSQRDIFLALADENFEKSPQLKSISRVYKKVNDEFKEGLRNMIYSG